MKHFMIVRRVSVNGRALAPDGNENTVPGKCNNGEKIPIPYTKSDARGSDFQSMGQEDRKEQ
jgi:hypothetical protein